MRRMISKRQQEKIEVLNNVYYDTEGELVFDDPINFSEDIQVDGDLRLEGENISFKGLKLGVEEVEGVNRFGMYYHIDEEPDEWKKVADAYSETTKLAQGITAANVVENQWTTATTPPPGGESIQDGEILYVVGFIGSMVLLCLGAGPDVQYWYSDDTTSKLKIKTGTYTVVEDTYSGYEEGVQEQDIFMPFATE